MTNVLPSNGARQAISPISNLHEKGKLVKATVSR